MLLERPCSLRYRPFVVIESRCVNLGLCGSCGTRHILTSRSDDIDPFAGISRFANDAGAHSPRVFPCFDEISSGREQERYAADRIAIN